MNKVKVKINKTILYFKKYGFVQLLKKAAKKMLYSQQREYDIWRKQNSPSALELEKQRKEKFSYEPVISIVVPLYKTPIHFLDELIQSIFNQTYVNWELCLSDGSGVDSPLTHILQKYAQLDERIKIAYASTQMDISDNTNHALQMASGEYVVFADHDDVLAPDALYECVKSLKGEEKWDLIYSDEDKISSDGKKFFQPHFKSDFNIDLLRSMNYFCHLVMVKKVLIDSLEGLNKEYDGAQDYDFILRCIDVTDKIRHIPKILYHWRAHTASTADGLDNKGYAFEAGKKALESHYRRNQLNVEVLEGEFPGTYRTKYLLETEPLVSIIIPNKDHIQDLEKCLNSIDKNCYRNYECLIVENNSEDPETFLYYEKIEQFHPKARVVVWNREFNYAAINNFAAQNAKGDYFLFLNNDTEMKNDSCISELVGCCYARDEVGVVGARLFFPDNTIQHAGVVIGYAGIVGHAFIGSMSGEPGYFARICCMQDYSAVTAACMLVKRDVFENVNGFDEEFVVAFNDVDFCLKVREKEKLVVYNPYAELFHYESKTRGLEDTEEKKKRFERESTMLKQHWKPYFELGDPYYNRNLTLNKQDFSLKLEKH